MMKKRIQSALISVYYKEGLENIANTVIHMAEAEGLEAHANAVRVRI